MESGPNIAPINGRLVNQTSPTVPATSPLANMPQSTPPLPLLASRITVCFLLRARTPCRLHCPITDMIKLQNGATIPQIQLGLYMMTGSEARKSVHWGLLAGYRGFDSAQMYHNEREAGRAISDFLSGAENTQGLKREDIFYTTKLASNSTSYEAVRRSIKNSVDISGLGYVDLFLLHSPYGGRKARLESWRALEDAVQAGEVRIPGVSNFGVGHVSR